MRTDFTRVKIDSRQRRADFIDFRPKTAGYPIILTILDLWVRRVTIVGFLDSFTMGK